MATEDQRVTRIFEAREAIDDLIAFDPKTLAKPNERDERMRFEDASQEAARVIELYWRLLSFSLDALCFDHARVIATGAQRALELFKEIVEYTPGQGVVYTRGKEIAGEISELYDKTLVMLAPIQAFLASVTDPYANMKVMWDAELRESLADIETIKGELATTLEKAKADEAESLKAKEEIAKMLEDARIAVGEVGVVEHRKLFEESA